MTDLQSFDVYINIYYYKYSKFFKLLHYLGIGAYHSSLSIGNKEIAYGYCKDGSGVYICDSFPDPNYTFYNSIYVKRVIMNKAKINNIFLKIKYEYPGRKYDILKFNCHTFTNDLCKRLCGNEVPCWINRLPRWISIISVSITKNFF